MKIIKDIIRFIIFIPICLIIFWLIYLWFTYLIVFFLNLNIFLLIFITIFLWAFIWWLFKYITFYIIYFTSLIMPYKNIRLWWIISFAIINWITMIYNTFTYVETNLFFKIIISLLILEMTWAICIWGYVWKYNDENNN
jgi:hypothetical protein